MLEEAIQLVVAKTGISHDQATSAVHTVIGFLKQRLPAPLAGHLDSLVAGGGASGGIGGMLGGLASGMGGGQPAQGKPSEEPSAAASVEGALGGLFGK